MSLSLAAALSAISCFLAGRAAASYARAHRWTAVQKRRIPRGCALLGAALTPAITVALDGATWQGVLSALVIGLGSGLAASGAHEAAKAVTP